MWKWYEADIRCGPLLLDISSSVSGTYCDVTGRDLA